MTTSGPAVAASIALFGVAIFALCLLMQVCGVDSLRLVRRVAGGVVAGVALVATLAFTGARRAALPSKPAARAVQAGSS